MVGIIKMIREKKMGCLETARHFQVVTSVWLLNLISGFATTVNNYFMIQFFQNVTLLPRKNKIKRLAFIFYKNIAPNVSIPYFCTRSILGTIFVFLILLGYWKSFIALKLQKRS